jgi:hypothetical protein
MALAGLIVGCVVTRLVTTIYYVEDPDSLHFALSMVDFDVARLQPHFPGYVVFVGIARGLAALTGSFAIGFSLVGALATALLVCGLLALARWPLASRRGAFLAVVVLGNGMLWLYANRYMPDLLGCALLVWSLHDLTADDGRIRVRGGFVAALLAGTRLSYLPFLLPVVIHALARRPRRGALALSFVAGCVLWAVPLVGLTGWTELIAIARNQTSGHFDEFGGTIRTEPDLALRLERIAEGLWTDALGGFVPGRSPLTLVTGLVSLAGLALASPLARRALTARGASASRNDRWRLIAVGALCYLVWIFFYQNVIHHSRHLLPFAPLLALAVAAGLEKLVTRPRIGPALAVASLCSIVALGSTLAWQHRRPSAIAQVSRALASARSPLAIVSTGIVNDYLAATGVHARFLAIDRDSIADSMRTLPAGATIMSVGDYRSLIPLGTRTLTRFYHNPYVNRIWPVLEVYEYRVEGGAR